MPLLQIDRQPPAPIDSPARLGSWRTPYRLLGRFFLSRPLSGRIALLLVAATLSAATLRPVAVSLVRILSAIQGTGTGTLAGRTRIFGSGYTQTVETIRRTLRDTAPYALLEAGSPDEGGTLWLRYDLAPRKAIELGRMGDLATHPDRFERLSGEVRWIVVSHGYGANPEILDRRQFVALLERSRHGL